jgi:Mn2+/Fe2+ NRAMP family transporter
MIAASAGNDAGGISTYSVAGAEYGYGMLWLVPLMTLALVVVQEMAVRTGAVTGKGFAALIRERFGIRLSFLAMAALVVSNAATSVSEFAGIASAMEIFGVSRYVAVPVAALAVWLLVVRGSYRRVEKIMLALSALFIAYIAAAVLAKPDWAEVARATVVPHITPTTGFLFLAIAMVGTTIAPWMQFFVQSNVVDKGLTVRDLALQRIDVIAGTLAAGFIAWCIVLTTGTVLHGGAGIETAADAAAALAPVAGAYATQLFALGLLGASLLAACVLPLTAAYAVCEAFGFERGIDRSWAEAPVFNGIYTFVIVFGAAFILIPGLDLIRIMVFSQVIGGVLLPFLLVFMMIIVNDRSIMGRHVNGRLHNVVAWATIGVAVGLTVALLGMTAFGFS